VEQKAAWLQVRQQRPDYVFLWGWGVMNSTAIKEAVATGYPRDKMYGVWWSGAEPDVKPAGEGAKGYHALALQHSAGRAKVHEDVLKYVHGKGQGTGPAEEVGEVLYTRGLISAMLAVEGLRKAQTRYGQKPLTGEQVRWGLENLYIDDAAIKKMGFDGVMQPVQTTCKDHQGAQKARIHTWDGTKWVLDGTWYEADETIMKPMVTNAAKRYAAEKKIDIRDCAKDAQS
jgi:branched-chain amino acid transport system substrate-binding protein